jgi:hypothetical protein
VNTVRPRILVLAAALAFLSPALRAEQSQKSSRATQEDRIKKLEERADAAEKAASAAAMEKDYIARAQKLYESYYEKTFSKELWTLAIVGLILTAVFGIVARFSLNLFEQRTKLATADATAQVRNEYARILAKEAQKRSVSNAADTKKLRDALTMKTVELEQNLKDRSDFQIRFVQGLIAGTEERHGNTVVTFRQALRTYKSSKPRNLFETELGAATVKFVFEALQEKHGETYVEEGRVELADALYDGLEEELALAALHIPWLTPLINERSPATPEPPVLEKAAEPRPTALTPPVRSAEPDWTSDEEADSCRLINS